MVFKQYARISATKAYEETGDSKQVYKEMVHIF
jgi:hypothetical protein